MTQDNCNTMSTEESKTHTKEPFMVLTNTINSAAEETEPLGWKG